MWLFTRFGFFSVVCAHDDGEKMMIRARCRRHLVNLCNHFKLRKAAIRETLSTDYRFRLFVDREEWEYIATCLAKDINWDNFKDRVKQSKDEEYHDALHEVWSVMLQLQPGRPQRGGIHPSIHDRALPPPTEWGLPQDEEQDNG